MIESDFLILDKSVTPTMNTTTTNNKNHHHQDHCRHNSATRSREHIGNDARGLLRLTCRSEVVVQESICARDSGRWREAMQRLYIVTLKRRTNI